MSVLILKSLEGISKNAASNGFSVRANVVIIIHNIVKELINDLESIANMPTPEQDNTISAIMRAVAVKALARLETE